MCVDASTLSFNNVDISSQSCWSLITYMFSGQTIIEPVIQSGLC